jgi:glycosyltransferase involved in cell wall biosynthesis
VTPRPLVSVIMPSFGHKDLISQSLRAILGQSWAPAEVIVVDDASTDGSYDLVDELRYEFENLYQVRNVTNHGPVWSARRGFAASRGDLVMFAAADDMILPGHLERSVELLRQFPKAGLSCCFVDVLGAEPRRRPPIPGGYWAREDLLERPLRISGAGCLYRREPYLEAGGNLIELGSACDWFLSLVVAYRYGFCLVPETLALISVRPGETFSTSQDPADRGDIFAMLEQLLGSLEYADVSPFITPRLRRGNPELPELAT